MHALSARATAMPLETDLRYLPPWHPVLTNSNSRMVVCDTDNLVVLHCLLKGRTTFHVHMHCGCGAERGLPCDYCQTAP